MVKKAVVSFPANSFPERYGNPIMYEMPPIKAIATTNRLIWITSETEKLVDLKNT